MIETSRVSLGKLVWERNHGDRAANATPKTPRIKDGHTWIAHLITKSPNPKTIFVGRIPICMPQYTLQRQDALNLTSRTLTLYI